MGSTQRYNSGGQPTDKPSTWPTRALLLLAVFGTAAWLWSSLFLHVRNVEATVAYVPFEMGPEPLVLQTPVDETIRGRVRKGQSVFSLLSRHGVSKAGVAKLVRAAKRFKDLNRIRVGQGYRVRLNDSGKFQDFELDLSNGRMLRVSLTPFGFMADLHDISYDTRVASFSGTARNSLFANLMNVRGGAELIRQLQDLLAWRVDFNRDIRQGDTFRLLVEEIWRDGEFDRYGPVRYVQINSNGRTIEGIHYRGEYYDTDGKALRATLLPAPVDYEYISSRFSYARRHPVYGTVRPHYGVDFVARYGTPVRAAGDGVVSFSGWKGDNGRLIKIRHNGVYRTAYAHLSSYAKGIKRGARVKQGQVIGYVGNSGTSTGTHLHYGVYRNGRVIDPLGLDYAPVAKAIDPLATEGFQVAWDEARLALTRQEARQTSAAPRQMAGLSLDRP